MLQKHSLDCAIHEIKHLAGGLDANKALGFALCFISLLAICLALYFPYNGCDMRVSKHLKYTPISDHYILTLLKRTTKVLENEDNLKFYAFLCSA